LLSPCKASSSSAAAALPEALRPVELERGGIDHPSQTRAVGLVANFASDVSKRSPFLANFENFAQRNCMRRMTHA
jgi:hypothetical protein